MKSTLFGAFALVAVLCAMSVTNGEAYYVRVDFLGTITQIHNEKSRINEFIAVGDSFSGFLIDYNSDPFKKDAWGNYYRSLGVKPTHWPISAINTGSYVARGCKTPLAST